MPESIYFSTFKNYNFTDVAISKGSFSAIIDAKDNTIFAFVNDEKINPEETYFTGKFIKNGKEKVLSIKLSNCIKSSYKESDYFLQTKKSNYFIDEKEYNKKGFWAWVKRLFEKDDDN